MNFVANFLMQFQLFAHTDPGCEKSFLTLPTWYHYLHVHEARDCAPRLDGLNDIWLIGLAVVEILLRIAILAAIAFTVYAGIKFAASRGNADKVESARNTLLDALTGLIIAIIATAVVAFIGTRFS